MTPRLFSISVAIVLLSNWAIGGAPSIRSAFEATTAPADDSPSSWVPITGEASDNTLQQHTLPVDPTQPQPAPPIKSGSDNEWIIAPIPSHDPAQGFGLALTAQYIFHPDATDKVTPPSVFGLGAFGTQEESYGGFAGYQGILDHDKWRLGAAASAGRINYDFYGIGNAAAELDIAIPVEQTYEMGFVQLLRRVDQGLYIGPRVRLSHVDQDLDLTEVANAIGQNISSAELQSLDVSAGVKIQYDTRDNHFFPRHGIYINGSADFHGEGLGGDFNYQDYRVNYNQYFPLFTSSVLAVRVATEYVNGDAPFFALAKFGSHNDLRGYESGKYRDNFLLAAQAEYRQMLNNWLGYVVFTGVGGVSDNLGDFDEDKLLPSVGVGLRFRLGRKNPVNFRLDWAVGDDGSSFYLSVGEAY